MLELFAVILGATGALDILTDAAGVGSTGSGRLTAVDSFMTVDEGALEVVEATGSTLLSFLSSAVSFSDVDAAAIF